MIIYRGHEVIEVRPRIFHVITDRPGLGRVLIGGFTNQVEAFRFVDDILIDLAHPWRNDFRELVRLMSGQVDIPHGIRCNHCLDAIKLRREVQQNVNAHSR